MEFTTIAKNDFDNLKSLFPDDDIIWEKYRQKRLKQIEKQEITIFVIIENEKIIGEITANYKSNALEEETIPNKRIYFEAFRIEKTYQKKRIRTSSNKLCHRIFKTKKLFRIYNWRRR